MDGGVMKMDIAALATAFGVGGIVGSVVSLVLKHHLDRRHEWLRRRIETDRATYQERMTRLIAASLYAYIHSNRYRDGEKEELEQLIQELSDGAHQVRFLDVKVQAAWALLVRKTAECGWRRLADMITDQDVADYTKTLDTWLIAARVSFGPLPENDRPVMRRSATTASFERAA
jgi:hypothetical protein